MVPGSQSVKKICRKKTDMLLKTGYPPTFWTWNMKPIHGEWKNHGMADLSFRSPNKNGFRGSENVDNINAELVKGNTTGQLAQKHKARMWSVKIQHNMVRNVLLTIRTPGTRFNGLRILGFFSYQHTFLNLILTTYMTTEDR